VETFVSVVSSVDVDVGSSVDVDVGTTVDVDVGTTVDVDVGTSVDVDVGSSVMDATGGVSLFVRVVVDVEVVPSSLWHPAIPTTPNIDVLRKNARRSIKRPIDQPGLKVAMQTRQYSRWRCPIWNRLELHTARSSILGRSDFAVSWLNGGFI
jgi:hypothetical protein